MDNVLNKIGAAVAAQLTLTDSLGNVTYPFDARWDTGFADDDFIANNDVGVGLPWLSIYGSPRYQRSWALVKSEAQDPTISAITHVGTSILTYAITGTNVGNNNYVLEVMTAGAFGTATYHLSTDGGTTYGDETTTPVSGAILVGDGTTITFSTPGTFVIDDTYAWITTSLVTQTYRSYEFEGTVSLEIIAGSKDEFSGKIADNHIGYHDQLVSLLSEKTGIEIDDNSWVHLDLGSAPTVIIDNRITKFRGLVTVDIRGELYFTKSIPQTSTIEVVYE